MRKTVYLAFQEYFRGQNRLNTLDVKVVIYNIYLSQSEDALLGSNTTSLDHDKVLLDQTVMGEPAHGVDGLIGQVVIGGSIVLDKLKFIKK